MKKHLYFILIFNLLALFTYGQSEFYTTDSTMLVGIKLIDGGEIDNSRFCQVKEAEKIIKYSPYEVKEYGFKDGRIYKSFPIKMNDTISRYFLENLVEGKVSLYYLRAEGGIKKYYVMDGDNNNKLSELTQLQEEFSILLNSFIKDCPQAIHNIPYIKLRKHSLIRFVKDYDYCANRPFPRFKYGFTIGLNATRLSAVDNDSRYSVPNYNNDWNISIGAFMDIPVQFSNFSFHPELHYKHTGISIAFDNENSSNDLVINYSSIYIPLLFRYIKLSNKISSYFQVGPVYSRAIRNSGTLYEYQKANDDIFIDIIDSPVMQKNMGGFSVGSGMISKYGSKYSWFGELRYGKFYNLGQGSQLLNLSEISLGIGLIF